jgi:putative FmdB family regulatory protein
MPIYEYECQACQKITEARQGISDAPLTTCGDCGGQLCKIISQSSFRLKGGGWYADGYSSSCSSTKCPAAAGSSSASSPTPAAPPCAGTCGC